jgi:hypothetical protein
LIKASLCVETDRPDEPRDKGLVLTVKTLINDNNPEKSSIEEFLHNIKTNQDQLMLKISQSEDVERMLNVGTIIKIANDQAIEAQLKIELVKKELNEPSTTSFKKSNSVSLKTLEEFNNFVKNQLNGNFNMISSTEHDIRTIMNQIGPMNQNSNTCSILANIFSSFRETLEDKKYYEQECQKLESKLKISLKNIDEIQKNIDFILPVLNNIQGKNDLIVKTVEREKNRLTDDLKATQALTESAVVIAKQNHENDLSFKDKIISITQEYQNKEDEGKNYDKSALELTANERIRTIYMFLLKSRVSNVEQRRQYINEMRSLNSLDSLNKIIEFIMDNDF